MSIHICGICGRDVKVVDGYDMCIPCDQISSHCECDPSLLFRQTTALEGILREVSRVADNVHLLAEV